MNYRGRGPFFMRLIRVNVGLVSTVNEQLILSDVDDAQVRTEF